MDTVTGLFDPGFLALAALITLGAGFVKGVVGFAMPMLLVSGLGAFAPAETALAGLILPTLVTNFWQAGRNGLGAAWASAHRYRVFLITGAVMLVLSAQLVRHMPPALSLIVIGVPILLFAVSELMGRGLTLSTQGAHRAEAGFGAVAGLMGGLSGIWGPPTVAMLTAQNTPKADQIRIQGVIYFGGSVLLLLAHLGSGVLSGPRLLFSAALVIPAITGQMIGLRVMDRIDQALFRKLTLIVLCLSGLNLLRRAVMGG